jgi:HAD superfamily hydrolase (TIGR01509 family)
MMPTCLIFDLDGTLIDSEPLCSQVFLDLLPEIDEPLDRFIRRYRGQRMADVYEAIGLRVGRLLDEDFQRQYRDRVAFLYDTQLKAMPGVMTMLADSDRPACVASNGPLAKMHHGLRATGLARFFGDRVFSAYDVGHWKPEPQLFLHAARRMGFPPEQCVVVEDSEAGVAAANAAGMRVIHFRLDSEPPMVAAHDAVISHFAQLEPVLRSIRER